mmetsp:Transcript_19551/g.61938  ORF Transcript_19551/g.61938 Transcript_19551/m.61938 type:complete len:225 (+) Transcript_19551:188-862(+)
MRLALGLWQHGEELGHDAAYRPHVNGGCVALHEDELRRPVPPSHHVRGELSRDEHRPSLLSFARGLGNERRRAENPVLVHHARESKIANLHVAATIQEHVGRLEVAVKHVGGVYVLECCQCLAHNPLDMLERDRLWGHDELAHVQVHVVHHDPQVLKRLEVEGAQQAPDLDHVRVIEMSQYAQLAKEALRLSHVVEAVGHLLDSHQLLCLHVDRGADFPVGATP